MSTSTPWGPSQTARCLAPGIMQYSTAGHGGIHLSPKREAQVHPAWKAWAGRPWYEEDCDWAIVALTFPEAFSVEDFKSAVSTLRHYQPDEYTLVTGQPVALAESHVLEERAFRALHKDDWVVAAAWGSWHKNVPAGMVGVVCRKAGAGKDEAWFLVPHAEYDARTDGRFVIDLARHQKWEAHA